MELTKEQLLALEVLAQALVHATNTGLFDVLTRELYPNVINDFCDGVMDEHSRITTKGK